MKKNALSYIFISTLVIATTIYLVFKGERTQTKAKSVRLKQLLEYQGGKVVKVSNVQSESFLNVREPTSSSQLTTLDSEKTKPMLTLEENAGQWLINLAQGHDSRASRNALLEQSKLYPLEALDLIEEILQEVPRDQTEIRDQLLAVVIDLAADLRKNSEESLTHSFFSQVQAMALNEFKFNEFVGTPMLSGLNSEQTDMLVHDGFFVEVNGEIKRSTLTNKVMAIKLAQLDPDTKRKSDFNFEVETLSQAMIDDFTKQTLLMVLKETK